MFGVLMAIVTLAAAGWLTRPLWRATVDERQRRRAANVTAFRQRLAELVVDEGAGLLDGDTAGALRTELEARLLREAEAPDAPVTAGGRGLVLASILALLVGALAVAGYAMQGSWKVQQQVAHGGPVPGGGPPGTVEEMVGRLEKKLEQEPGNAEGWAMLGRSYFVMQRYGDSAKAYGKANELTGQQEPDLLVNEGEALALARDRDLLGRPQQLFDAALKVAPDHGKALWYAGLAATQAGDNATALARWTALAKQDLPDELRKVLNERLDQAANALGQPPPAIAAASPPVPPLAAAGASSSRAGGDASASSQRGAAAPGPASSALASAGATGGGNAPAAAGGVVLRVDVSLAPDLAARVPADAALFVFAKAASGPPMPLAVYRGKAAELPREVRLDDSMAMTPALKLSQFDRWTVTARISKGGQAIAASGDIQGTLTVGRADVGSSALALVLDQVVP